MSRGEAPGLGTLRLHSAQKRAGRTRYYASETEGLQGQQTSPSASKNPWVSTQGLRASIFRVCACVCFNFNFSLDVSRGELLLLSCSRLHTWTFEQTKCRVGAPISIGRAPASEAAVEVRVAAPKPWDPATSPPLSPSSRPALPPYCRLALAEDPP